MKVKIEKEIELPEPPALPKGYKYVDRGLGWKAKSVYYAVCYPEPDGYCWLSSCLNRSKDSANGCERMYYLEIVKTHYPCGTPVEFPDPMNPENHSTAYLPIKEIDKMEYVGCGLEKEHGDYDDIAFYNQGTERWLFDNMETTLGLERYTCVKVWYKKPTEIKTSFSINGYYGVYDVNQECWKFRFANNKFSKSTIDDFAEFFKKYEGVESISFKQYDIKQLNKNQVIEMKNLQDNAKRN